MPKFLIFAGSARKASTNKQLAALAAGTAKAAGADVRQSQAMRSIPWEL